MLLLTSRIILNEQEEIMETCLGHVGTKLVASLLFIIIIIIMANTNTLHMLPFSLNHYYHLYYNDHRLISLDNCCFFLVFSYKFEVTMFTLNLTSSSALSSSSPSISFYLFILGCIPFLVLVVALSFFPLVDVLAVFRQSTIIRH